MPMIPLAPEARAVLVLERTAQTLALQQGETGDDLLACASAMLVTAAARVHMTVLAQEFGHGDDVPPEILEKVIRAGESSLRKCCRAAMGLPAEEAVAHG